MNINQRMLVTVLGCLLLGTTTSSLAAPRKAQVLCVKNSDSTLKVRTKCKSSETKLANRDSLVGSAGATGETGAAGAAGVLGVYGDGSAGALNAAGGALGTGNLQFTTCNVALGQLLTVPSGAVLRCTGTATIAGTISVTNGANGGAVTSSPSTNVFTSAGSGPSAGITRSVAQNGEMGGAGAVLNGGLSGFAMSDDELRLSYRPSLFGCGGGGGSGGAGGNGGGYFAILAKGGISVTGAIAAGGANGSSGGGGGAGGVIVLASQTSVILGSASTVSTNGGSGGASSTTNGGGGGGAGGIVHIIAPAITTSGTISIAGGIAGEANIAITAATAIAGGSGGNCVFSGAAGGNVPIGRPAAPGFPSDGNVGFSQQLLADPTTLFFN